MVFLQYHQPFVRLFTRKGKKVKHLAHPNNFGKIQFKICLLFLTNEKYNQLEKYIIKGA